MELRIKCPTISYSEQAIFTAKKNSSFLKQQNFLYLEPLVVHMPKSMYKKKGKRSSSKKKLSRYDKSLRDDKKGLKKKHDMKEMDKGTDYDFY